MDNESYTIDHLLGTLCILSNSVELTPTRNKKEKPIELQASDGTCSFIIIKVVGAIANGGFKVQITSPRGGQVHEAVIITKALFIKERGKVSLIGATAGS